MVQFLGSTVSLLKMPREILIKLQNDYISSKIQIVRNAIGQMGQVFLTSKRKGWTENLKLKKNSKTPNFERNEQD